MLSATGAWRFASSPSTFGRSRPRWTKSRTLGSRTTIRTSVSSRSRSRITPSEYGLCRNRTGRRGRCGDRNRRHRAAREPPGRVRARRPRVRRAEGGSSPPSHRPRPRWQAGHSRRGTVVGRPRARFPCRAPDGPHLRPQAQRAVCSHLGAVDRGQLERLQLPEPAVALFPERDVAAHPQLEAVQGGLQLEAPPVDRGGEGENRAPRAAGAERETLRSARRAARSEPTPSFARLAFVLGSPLAFTRWVALVRWTEGPWP